MAVFVDQPVDLQYLGFESKGVVRKYAFSRRGVKGQSHYFVTIANETLAAHRARYQDTPAICSIRLRREFAIRGGQSSLRHVLGDRCRAGRMQ